MDSKSLKILKIYQTRSALNLHQLAAILNESPYGALAEYVVGLRQDEYLRIEPNHAVLHSMGSESPLGLDTPLQISIKGIAAIESEHRISKQHRNEWIRYIITTAIALAAFIKSFFF